MKKLYFLFFILVTSSFSYGQELLLNGDFETWTTATAPTSWTTATNVNQESTTIHGGTYSALQAPTATSYITQKITGLTPGDAITLSLWYKSSGDGTDVRIWSKWGNNGTLDSTTDAAILQGPNDAYLTNGDWTQYTLNLTVPATANEFNFEVRTYNGGTVYWDDFSFFKTSGSSCDLALGATTAICDAITTGTDTYTATVAFTGGGTETYTITPSSGTVSGDNPTSDTTGTIIISGINEGTNLTLDITSTNCDLAANITSPTCVPVGTLPIYEPFNYTVATNLGGQGGWVNYNTGDEVAVATGNLSYSGLNASTGNSISFNGGGIDPQLTYALQNAGTVYASFIMKVTDLTAATNTAGGYFFGLGSTSTNFASTVWTLKDGDNYKIGLDKSTSTTNHVFTSSTYAINENVFVVISYDFASNTSKMWVNPTELGGTEPTQTLLATLGTDRTSLDRVFLRQDSDSETPFLVVDEIRVGNTWASVTPSDSASINDSEIEGFSIYPNPTHNTINIFTTANLTKNVQIFDLVGKQVVNEMVTGNSLNFNLKSGIYVVKVEEAGKVATQKLVIE
jgi:hypothetical protein